MLSMFARVEFGGEFDPTLMVMCYKIHVVQRSVRQLLHVAGNIDANFFACFAAGGLCWQFCIFSRAAGQVVLTRM